MASRLYSKDFEIHAFECNPVLRDSAFIDYPKGVMIYREAAWIFDGEIDFFVNKLKLQNVQGSSIYKEKTTGDLDKDHPVKIKCIDFSKWLIENFFKDDNIILKSNIEGAEYQLFPHLIKTGAIEYINRLHIRRHWHKIGLPEEIDKQFFEQLQSIKTLTLKTDYDFS